MLLIALGAVVFVALLAWMTVSGKKFRVEVCMSHEGRSACKVAAGATREAALRTAVDNACALIAFGVTENGQCTRSVPLRITDLE
jgi:hypothetical protein